MTIRFFVLQAHYRGTLDFSNDALVAAEKGMGKLYAAIAQLPKLTESDHSDEDISAWVQRCYDAMNDDLNTPKLISELFDAVRIINSIKDKKIALNAQDLEMLQKYFKIFFYEILGMKEEEAHGNSEYTDKLMSLIIDIRKDAKANKNWTVADLIRDKLTEMGITLKDTKEGTTYELN